MNMDCLTVTNRAFKYQAHLDRVLCHLVVSCNILPRGPQDSVFSCSVPQTIADYQGKIVLSK